jgi:hypothetical protein
MILDKFTIQTQDSVDVARNKLIGQIHDRSSLFTSRSKPSVLCGEVYEDTFSLCHVSGSGQLMTIINGWFEAVQSGTVVHLEVELNLKVAVISSLSSLCFIMACQGEVREPQYTIRAVFMSIAVGFFVISIYSCHLDLRFYRKKLSQVFS